YSFALSLMIKGTVKLAFLGGAVLAGYQAASQLMITPAQMDSNLIKQCIKTPTFLGCQDILEVAGGKLNFKNSLNKSVICDEPPNFGMYVKASSEKTISDASTGSDASAGKKQESTSSTLVDTPVQVPLPKFYDWESLIQYGRKNPQRLNLTK